MTIKEKILAGNPVDFNEPKNQRELYPFILEHLTDPSSNSKNLEEALIILIAWENATKKEPTMPGPTKESPTTCLSEDFRITTPTQIAQTKYEALTQQKLMGTTENYSEQEQQSRLYRSAFFNTEFQTGKSLTSFEKQLVHEKSGDYLLDLHSN